MPITQDTIENIKSFKNPVLRRQYAYLWRHPQIKEVFFAVETADVIFEIAQKYHLQTEKMRCLAKIAGLVLLSEIKLENFEHEIQKQCSFIPESAKDIAREVDEKIFSKVKQFLEKPKKNVRIESVGAGHVLPAKHEIHKELRNHGIEIRKIKPDKYREAIA